MELLLFVGKVWLGITLSCALIICTIVALYDGEQDNWLMMRGPDHW